MDERDADGTHNSVQGATVYGSVFQAHTISMQALPLVMPGAPVPRSLPAVTSCFTNRSGELDPLVAALQDAESAPRVVTFSGSGGIGKTALAVRLGELVRPLFPDGQLYADLRGSSAASAASAPQVLRRLLLALGVNPQYVPVDPEEQADLFRSLTADRRVFLLLDDALSAAQVRPLIATTQGSVTVVTSRYALPGLVGEFGARSVRLGAFAAADAIRLLAKVSGRGETRGIEAVARRCAGEPLALCTAAARLVVQPGLSWSSLDGEFGATVDGESEAGSPSDGDTADGDTVTKPDLLGAYADLSAAAVRLHGLLAIRSWPHFGAGVAAAALGGDVTEPEAEALLGELWRANLVERLAEGRYRFHERVREQAERWVRNEVGPAELTSSVRRVVLWYRGFTVAADSCVIGQRWHLGPGYAIRKGSAAAYPDSASALSALADQRENLVEAVVAAAEFGFDELVWQLCEALWGLFLRLGYHEDWERTHLLGVDAAVRLGDLRAEGRMRCQLAFAYLPLSRFAEAEEQLIAAERVDAEAGHDRGRATAIESLGLLRLKQQRPDEAAACFERARGLAEGVGDPRAVALLEHHLGRALRDAGEYERASARLASALELMRALDEPDPYNVGRVLTSIGELGLAAGRYDEASAALGQAAEIMDREQAVIQQGEVAELRAQCARRLGDAVAERGYLDAALVFHRRTGSPRVHAVIRRLEELDSDSATP